MITHAEFKAALDTVDGVKGFVGRPSAPTTGDAYPIRGTATRDEESGLFLVDWQVAVFIPQDDTAANMWMDDHTPDILTALDRLSYVTSFAPGNLGNDQNFVKGLLFNLGSD